MAFFGLAVAPAAFAVAPEPELAGRLVGRVLGPLQVGGAFAGLVLAGLATRLGRSRLTIALPAVLAILCLFNHFGVSPAVAEIRPSHLGAPGTAPGDAERFALLHRVSVALFGATALGALVLAALHGRVEGQIPQR